ncbi:unnamed protein product [Calicophoron daubneyi]|uniref:Uncharacterized protein n=1 Tax=Calicophoron daubneyi TaxID=300641 RepID=A0AAV2TKX5_CALDB
MLRKLCTFGFVLLWISLLTLVLTEPSADDPNECRTANGESDEYQGKISVAYDGTPCQAWTKHPHFYRTHWSHEEAAKEKNYCRNPDGDIHGPWCVVQKTSFKYCNVPKCAKDVECYEDKGEDYRGSQDRTIDGIPCKVWSLTSAVRLSHNLFRFQIHYNSSHSEVLKPGDSRMDKFQSCRNPGGTESRPWCYTIPMSGVKHEKNFCDVPKCSDPSTLGYPLLSNDRHCPPNFIQQTEVIAYKLSDSLQVNYCVAPQRLVYNLQKNGHYFSFTDFCMLLVGKSTYCPAGFQHIEIFQPNFHRVKHTSGPNTWHTSSESLLQIIVCCSSPDYFRNQTEKPYISMEKKSALYKRFERDSEKGMETSKFGTNWLWQPTEAEENSLGSTSSMLEPPAPNVPIFASVRRCPPVNGTTRVITSIARNQIGSDMPTDFLRSLLPEVVCEYYPLQSKNSQATSTDSSSDLALLISESACPQGYKGVQLSRLILFILGASSSLCVPTSGNVIPPPAQEAGYCMLRIPKQDTAHSEYSVSQWGHKTSFHCPPGFRSNELHFSSPEYRLQLCCTGNVNATRAGDTKLQAPFGARFSFAVIQNGETCPEFYAGAYKLNLVQYSRPIPRPYVEHLELLGNDSPVKPTGIPTTVICQYLSPETTLGVKSLTYECEGLGYRSAMNYNGATCGFEVNDTVVFPPGKYCLLQISSTCPPGFNRKSGVVRLGFSLQSIGNTCCRTEESIGAIKFPINFEAPFKLPAVYRPCQAIEKFTVDAELHHCVYYPQGAIPHALIVWPRIVGKTNISSALSFPANCAVMPRKRKKIHRSQMGRLTSLFFNIMQDQWLIYKRPRWTTRGSDSGDVCFNEVPWSLMPRTTADGNGYCIFSFGSCPQPGFETLGASTYMNGVLCCTVRSANGGSDSDASHPSATKPISSLVTLGHTMPSEKLNFNGFIGTKVLYSSTSGSDNESQQAHVKSCPQFADLKLNRRLIEGMPTPPQFKAQKLLTSNGVLGAHLPRLFNVTHLEEQLFTERTGIWLQDEIVYVTYCEYVSEKRQKTDERAPDRWPVANYALPKAMNQCPKGFQKAFIMHQQDQYGFHHSQPIHLDGMYLQGNSVVRLGYCVSKVETSSRPPYEDRTEDELPAGHYCVLRVRGKCPTGFSLGTLSIMEGPQKMDETSSPSDESGGDTSNNENSEPALLPDVERVRTHIKENVMKIDRLDYYFCCRSDSPSVNTPVSGFPTETGPFYLYRVGDKCQQIEGMEVSEEYICMDAPNRQDQSWWPLDKNRSWTPYSVKGLTPARIPFHSQCDVEINLCYYEKTIPQEENESALIKNDGDWPLGKYALPNVHRSDELTACPPGFTQHHFSLINHQATFFELELMPMSLGPYFLELIGHNYSALNVHYCDRNNPNNQTSTSADSDEDESATTTGPKMSFEEQEKQWPKGDYCVITTSADSQCPPGLHRYTRSVAELCCRDDNIKNPQTVNWPFTGDFFLFGGEVCLPVANTHVERYLVRLVAGSDEKSEGQWDVLCHYIPSDWFKEKVRWPSGNYLLPIGRRGGLKTTVLSKIQYTDEFTPEDLARGTPSTESVQKARYKCPDEFQRARFTFVSKNTEVSKMPGADGSPVDVKVVAVTSMEFCIRNESTENSTEVKWPEGDYCVFTMNSECPLEMRATKSLPLKIPRFLLKSVDFVNEIGDVIANKHWHEESYNHVFYFMQCCREDKSLILRLPPSPDGFYLASSSGLCSTVPGTVLDREKVTSYFTSPLLNRGSVQLNDRDMLLYRELVAQREGLMYLCYYHPGKGIDYSSALISSQFSTVNMTVKDIEAMAKICGCAPNAFCLPHKQAECICKPGYFGDGRHVCKEITPLTDECANLCDQSAMCIERMDTGFRKKKQVLSHICVCRPGYAGDGFTCQPNCALKDCQPFSRCVHDDIRGTTNCECIEGTIATDGRCHLDVYKTMQLEKDLPQFLVHHDHCLSESVQIALRNLEPKKYFYIFAPQELIRTCEDMLTHIVVMDAKITDAEIQAATKEAPIKFVTENRTVIEMYPENDTWIIDGNLSSQAPVKFVNGEMYMLSGELKRISYKAPKKGYIIMAVVLSSVILVGIAVVLFLFLSRRGVFASRGFLPLRNQLLGGRALWRRKGEHVLVEETGEE